MRNSGWGDVVARDASATSAEDISDKEFRTQIDANPFGSTPQ
jgi:hypothetical protein